MVGSYMTCDLAAALLNSYISECPPTELSNCMLVQDYLSVIIAEHLN